VKGLIWLGLAAITVWMAVLVIPDDNLHVVFCDVGQGDAILILKGTRQILIDTGPGKRILDCLSEKMPFYDKNLEVMVISHDQSDHAGGMKYVIESYNVTHIERMLRQGDEISLGELKVKVLSPENRVLGTSTESDKNELAIVSLVSWREFDALLTADASTKNYPAMEGVEVVKVPHHGSKTDLEPGWWQAVKPALAVVSVGKDNRFGHPTAEALQAIEASGARILRTDLMGTIEVVSDGVKWWVK